MKRIIGFLLILLFAIPGLLLADVDKLQAFQKSFLKAGLSTKIQILQDASDETDVDMGPLYLQALNFSIESAEILEDDVIARELSILAIRLVGVAGYREALQPLWELFTLDDNRSVRIESLSAIASLLPANPTIVDELNDWVMDQNDAFRNDEVVDLIVLSEAALTLGLLGDESSFSVLFSMSTSGYPESVADKARIALYKIDGNFSELIVQVLRQNPIAEKLEAYRLSIDNDEISDEIKAQIAEIALDEALVFSSRVSADRDNQRMLRYESVEVLSDFGWASATSNVIAHFNLVIAEVSTGIGSFTNLTDAIDAVGAMGTHEAAARLSLYQEVLNSDVENGKTVNEQVVLAVIRNLGMLGDDVAFENLLWVDWVDYPESVKRAALEALKKL